MSPTSEPVVPRPVRAYPGNPDVTIIIPCYNEAKFIESCIFSIVQGEYPHDKLEVLVLDGMSTDGTRDILAGLTAKFPFVKLVDNSRRLKPVALNLGIARAKGSVLIRLDAHAIYPPNYVRRLVEYLLTYDVVNVGGIRRNFPRSSTLQARVLARLLTHRFGVGDAKHYTGIDQPRFTDIVFLFCCRRELFEELGGFKEQLVRGQDREFNMRVAASGRKMLLVPDVQSTYFVRDTLKGFFGWAFDAGATPFRIQRFTSVNTVSIRNLVPPAFVLAIAAGLALYIFNPAYGLVLLAAVLGSYLLLALCASFIIAREEKDWRFAILMPLAFFSWHFSYGVGALAALMESVRQPRIESQ